MTLGNLLYEINTAYKNSVEQLEEHRHIPEVDNFLNRRKKDIDDFKNLVSGYLITDNVLSVQADLRRRGVEAKFYGGICLKGAEYFKVTKSIEKVISEQELSDEEICELQKEYYLTKENEEERQMSFDKDFAIFDELTPKEAEELLDE